MIYYQNDKFKVICMHIAYCRCCGKPKLRRIDLPASSGGSSVDLNNKSETDVAPWCLSVMDRSLGVVGWGVEHFRVLIKTSPWTGSWPTCRGCTSSPKVCSQYLYSWIKSMRFIFIIDIRMSLKRANHWRFGGLPETGIVDGETETLMAKPRFKSHQKLIFVK